MQTINRKIRIAFPALLIAQAAHSIEEYAFRLYDVFAPARFVSGLISSDLRTGFIVFNLGFLCFGLFTYAVLLRKASAAAVPLIWFWIVVEILNAVGHAAISIVEGAYVPGVATAPFLIVAAVYLLVQIKRRPHTSTG
jgi:hypothetical protein